MFEQVSLDIGGRMLTFETGKMARQAHGSVVARYGESMVLATACISVNQTPRWLVLDNRRWRRSSTEGGTRPAMLPPKLITSFTRRELMKE